MIITKWKNGQIHKKSLHLYSIQIYDIIIILIITKWKNSQINIL